MDIPENILVAVLALDKTFTDYEFIHAYLGPEEYQKQAQNLSPRQALEFLQGVSETLSIEDTFPYFRRTYIEDFVRSVIAQVKFFVYKENIAFQTLVESLLGARILPMFDIEKELAELKTEIQKLGFSSIREARNAPKKETMTFENVSQLESYIHDVIQNLAVTVANRCANLLDALPEILPKSQIKIESTDGNPPCFYGYCGKNVGKVGLEIRKSYTKAYIASFLLHEVMPGHHLYYLIRQHILDTQKVDPIFFIDTFYSPEIVVNEGLALNADLILQDALDLHVRSSVKIERFLHKLLYNCWFLTNISHSPIDIGYKKILQEEIGMSDAVIDARIEYYTNTDKYYIPSYPLGAGYVQNFIESLGLENLRLFYPQQSLNTMVKVEENRHGKKR